MLVEINNKTRSKIDLSLVKRVLANFIKWYYQQPRDLIGNKNKLKRGKKKSVMEVSIAFVGDKTIKQLNNRYRGVNRTTDVLAFASDYNSVDSTATQFLGEIIIDYQQIKRQARKYGHSVKQELLFILIHGLLHLLGYTDKTEKEKKKMENICQRALQEIYKRL